MVLAADQYNGWLLEIQQTGASLSHGDSDAILLLLEQRRSPPSTSSATVAPTNCSLLLPTCLRPACHDDHASGDTAGGHLARRSKRLPTQVTQ